MAEQKRQLSHLILEAVLGVFAGHPVSLPKRLSIRIVLWEDS
jgi:hypothetical protein